VNAELVADCAEVRIAAGARCLHDDARRAVLLVVAEGLLILRTLIPGAKRGAVTCHAGSGAVVLPAAEDEELVALSDCVLHCISAEDRKRLLADPETALALLEGLGDTLRQKHHSIANMTRLHHVDRVRLKLIELARDHGRVGKDGVRLDFPLTHDLLGEMTGSARETVTRALDELQREGFIARQGRTYSLRVQPEHLSVSMLTLRD
jgi:CRP-like cAMP-binding protein